MRKSKKLFANPTQAKADYLMSQGQCSLNEALEALEKHPSSNTLALKFIVDNQRNRARINAQSQVQPQQTNAEALGFTL